MILKRSISPVLRLGKTARGFEGPCQVIGQSKSHEVYDQILCFIGIKDQAALLIPVTLFFEPFCHVTNGSL